MVNHRFQMALRQEVREPVVTWEERASLEEPDMPRNEDGEFELVLGNKQLLTVFFIVVVLLGIFATMGYIVGRSTAPPAPEAKKDTASRQVPVVDPRASAEAPPETAAAKPTPLAPNQASVGGAQSQSATETQPQGSIGQEPKPGTAPPPRPESEKVQAKAPVGGPVFIEPAAGQTYLQVLAVAKADAEIAVNTLRKKDLPAFIAPGPPGQQKLYRVLVGPLESPAAITETRAKLKEIGFDNPLIRKY